MQIDLMAARAGLTALALATFALAGTAAAQPVPITADSRIEAVTVYPDGASVTRILRADLVAGDQMVVAQDFPLALEPASLRVTAEGPAGTLIGGIEALPQRAIDPPADPQTEQQLEALRDERSALNDTVAATETRKRFVERFADTVPFGLGEKADARPLGEWRAAFAAVGEELAEVNARLRAAAQRLRNIDREIARLEARLKAAPPRRTEVRIALAAAAAGPATLRVTYSVRGARWLPLYDARLDAAGADDGKARLELVRRAEITQQSGEDWDNVALTVSTIRTARGGSAPDLPPLIVRLQPERPPARVGRDRAGAPAAAPPAAPRMAAPAPAAEREAAVEAGAFQAVFRVPGRASIASGETATVVRLATKTYAPELTVRTVPAVDPTGFLEASFTHTEEAPLLPGRVAIYRDGVFVGRSRLGPAASQETVRLGFGADERIAVTRTQLRRHEGSAGIISSSKTDEQEYRVSVRNGHAQPMRVRIEERVPVSETEDVVVEMLAGGTPPAERDVRGRRGVLAWNLDVPAGETRDIRLGWRLRWPADRKVIFSAAGR